MINEYLNYIQEGHIFNDKNISVDLDKFESSKSSKLLVTGLSGAGKTTLGHKLEKIYKVPAYHTDYFVSESIKDLAKKHPGLKGLEGRELRKEVKNLRLDGKEFWFNCYKTYLKPLLESNERLILEGTIYYWYYRFPQTNELIIKHPSIILGNSTIISSYRAYKRDKKKSKQNNINLFFDRLSINLEFIKMLNKYRTDKIKTGNVKEFKND